MHLKTNTPTLHHSITGFNFLNPQNIQYAIIKAMTAAIYSRITSAKIAPTRRLRSRVLEGRFITRFIGELDPTPSQARAPAGRLTRQIKAGALPYALCPSLN